MIAHSPYDPGYETGRSELIASQLEALYAVSRTLNSSLDLNETLREVLKLLHDHGGLECGMVALLSESGEYMQTAAVHCFAEGAGPKARYKPGEGVVGAILQHGSSIVIPKLDQEPRFLDKLGIYDTRSPFLGVPIRLGDGGPVGVFAAQPPAGDESLIEERLRFLEMVANLIAQSVRLSLQVENERESIAKERDSLQRKVKSNYSLDNMVGRTAPMRRVFDLIRQVAKWNTTVLVRGESGT
ncbi:MAG: GAF domain-containing protein, partial [Gammaproteobacteria bacterium]